MRCQNRLCSPGGANPELPARFHRRAQTVVFTTFPARAPLHDIVLVFLRTQRKIVKHSIQIHDSPRGLKWFHGAFLLTPCSRAFTWSGVQYMGTAKI